MIVIKELLKINIFGIFFDIYPASIKNERAFDDFINHHKGTAWYYSIGDEEEINIFIWLK